MIDIDEAMEVVKRQLDEWDEQGVLEEKLIEYGFTIITKTPETNNLGGMLEDLS